MRGYSQSARDSRARRRPGHHAARRVGKRAFRFALPPSNPRKNDASGARIPDHQPQIDQDPLGVTFFRTFVGVGEDDLENLTLPRTFFGRSEIGPVSFKNTDLAESNLCWNDFNEVNFTDADLSGCDIRASFFSEIHFVRTNLRNADLRHSYFEACDFTDADMRGAKLTR